MQMFRTAIIAGVVCMFLLTPMFSEAQSKPLAATPPMGWNSWNHFTEKNVTDAIIRAQADAMVTSGMRDAGYQYINIDDGWQGARDEKGLLHPNEKFPDMKALADYVHGKGLKLGLYSSPGPATCTDSSLAGSYGHEEQDAQTYAAWGIDYLKYDLCTFGDMMEKAESAEKAHQMMVEAYTKMYKALQKTGRPIVYSLCQYGRDAVWKWGTSVGGNLWRTTDDISDKYDRMATIGFGQAGLSKYAGPGHWNDPDMLEVGNGGMTTEEYRTHMSLWAILAAPLLAGNDLTNMTPETRALLTNREVIGIDQDPAGVQGDRVWGEGLVEIWAKPLADGSKAVGVFNRQDELTKGAIVELKFSDLGFKGPVKVRDLWRGEDLGLLKGIYKMEIPSHGVVLLRVW